MIQKTFTIYDTTGLMALLMTMKEDEQYVDSACKFIHISDTDHHVEHISMTIEIIRDILPDAVVAGFTSVGGEGPEWSDFSGMIVSFFLFKESNAVVKSYSMNQYSSREAYRALADAAADTEDIKGIMLLASWDATVISEFIDESTKRDIEVPVFGVVAGLSPKAKEYLNDEVSTLEASSEYRSDFMRGMDERLNVAAITLGSRVGREIRNYTSLRACIYTNEEILLSGFVAVLFSGKNLRIRTGYNFGWTEIGKSLRVTEVGDSWIKTIDDRPAVDVYRRYLGVEPNKYMIANACDFPMIVHRGNRRVGRMAIDSDPSGSLMFFSDIKEDEKMWLSYGNQREILNETYRDSLELLEFDPQAVYISACTNRNIFLGKQSVEEIKYYKSVLKDAIVDYGGSEIYFDSEGGGLLNSSLISVGFREGEKKDEENYSIVYMRQNYNDESVVPLARRFAIFLEAITEDLREMVIREQKANRDKSDFLSRMSHEIRSPINAVLGLNEMILRETDDPVIRSYATDVQSSGKLLLSVINDILDSSKIESGKMELIDDKYDLSSMINDMVTMIGNRAATKDLKFIVRVNNDIPNWLCGDDSRIIQCALNILTNAVKYTPSGSVTLSVDYEPADEESIDLTISVKDTGIGINEEDLNKLFKPFERIEEKRNKSIEGTGLGMTIVKGLLALMDSHLDVKSVYGEGSEFSFTVRQGVINWEKIGNYEERHKKKIESMNYKEMFQAPDARVLVVDDADINLVVVEGLLKDTRIQIDKSLSGMEAIEKCRVNSYDCILMDHLMPKMDGVETLHKLKSMADNASKDAVVIILTANAASGSHEMYMKEGFDDYLSKPVSGVDLESMLLKHLPPEKILKEDDPDYRHNAAAVRSAPSDVGRISDMESLLFDMLGINISKALKNCGDKARLVDVASNFQLTVWDRIRDISSFLESEDIRNYTIQVHALKSSAMIIGAEELSNMAAHLEDAGNAGDIEEIRSRTPEMLALLQTYDKSLSPLTGKPPAGALQPGSDEEDQRSEIQEDELEEIYGVIAEFAEAYDFDAADDAVRSLNDYKIPESHREKVQKVRKYVFELNQEGLREILARG